MQPNMRDFTMLEKRVDTLTRELHRTDERRAKYSISGTCVRVWYLSLRGASGGSCTLQVAFKEPGESLVEEEWEIQWNDPLTAIDPAPSMTKSWNELTTVADPDNAGVFTLELLGGELPNGEVEIRITATGGWTVELEWLMADEALEGTYLAGLSRGYRSL